MTKGYDRLRLQPSLGREAERAAEAAGMTLDAFVDLVVAEKLSALRTDHYFRERAARGDVARALELLDRAGDEPPREGDEVEEVG